MADASIDILDALTTMVSHRFRHLPVVRAKNPLEEMMSFRMSGRLASAFGLHAVMGLRSEDKEYLQYDEVVGMIDISDVLQAIAAQQAAAEARAKRAAAAAAASNPEARAQPIGTSNEYNGGEALTGATDLPNMAGTDDESAAASLDSRTDGGSTRSARSDTVHANLHEHLVTLQMDELVPELVDIVREVAAQAALTIKLVKVRCWSAPGGGMKLPARVYRRRLSQPFAFHTPLASYLVYAAACVGVDRAVCGGRQGPCRRSSSHAGNPRYASMHEIQDREPHIMPAAGVRLAALFCPLLFVLHARTLKF